MTDERIPWTGHLGRRICNALARGGLARNFLSPSQPRSGTGLKPHCADHYFGVVHGGRMILARLLEIVGRLPAGITEINLHPGFGDARLARRMQPGGSEILSHPDHEAELDALLSPTFRHKPAAEKIELVRFRDAVTPEGMLKSA